MINQLVDAYSQGLAQVSEVANTVVGSGMSPTKEELDTWKTVKNDPDLLYAEMVRRYGPANAIQAGAKYAKRMEAKSGNV